MGTISRLLHKAFWAILSVFTTLVIIAAIGVLYLATELPDVDTLNEIQLQVPLRIYSADDQLMAEFGEMRRDPVGIEEIPQQLINAILATEDQRFYSHPGIDVLGLGRAFIELVRTGDKRQGGSTITMQVARNFFLTRQKTYMRKLQEILLAIKIDRELSKERILELYLNKIYFGNRAYGVAAAAQVYYGVPLDQLTLAQMAIIAGLPRAPSAINPLANPEAAMSRRNHVLERMLREEYINQATYEAAIAVPITARYHAPEITVSAPYVAEMIRQALYEHFGEDVYTEGYQVYTTIDSRLQAAANQALQQGLLDYDRRHGYRGAEDKLAAINHDEWQQALQAFLPIHGLYPAVVVLLAEQSVTVMLADGTEMTIPWSGLQWARRQLPSGYLGRAPETASDILSVGDVVRIQIADEGVRLTQIPDVEGALVALDANTGMIKSLVGGFSYRKSNFNRATQATRQPGSSFKPFVYAAALEYGLTMATIINDAPVVLDDPSQENLWRPQNHTRKFYGPTRLRVGLTNSRNLVSIRILQSIGIPFTVEFLGRFGFSETSLPRSLSLALGSLTVTPLELSAAYAMLANGGYKVTPYIINTITDEEGNIILQASPPPREPVLDSRIAYLITSALKDVIQQGTGRAALSLQRNDLAGKTGSTNQHIDAWFAGYNGELVATVWVGFDRPKSLREYGAKAALPIWVDFMGQALTGLPERSVSSPSGLVSVRIDPSTGLLAAPEQENSIFEMFREEHVPIQRVASPRTNSSQEGTDEDKQQMQHLF